MIFNIHAGHNPDGKTAHGAVGIVKESTEARAIASKVIEKLKAAGHTVYDCTVNDGTSQNDVLSKIVAKCNAHTVDLDISIHLNSGRNDYVGDGSTGGTEVFCYNVDSKAKPYAQKVAREISALGFRLRDDSIPDDIKTSSSLYVLKHTKAPAMLIETFFVDDKDDIDLYQKVGAEGIANAIVKGLTGATAPSVAATAASSSTSSSASALASAQAKSVDEVAKEVIQGKWGNGEDREKKLEAAGYNYTAVQQKVNEMLKDDNSSAAETKKEAWGTVTGEGVRIRKGPGTNYTALGHAVNGQRVRILEESGNWYRVDNDKWICATYVKKD